MWAAAKAWGLPIQLADMVQACRDCDACSKMRPRDLPETAAHLARGHNPLQRWQVDYIGPLPRSEGARYALTCVDCKWATAGLSSAKSKPGRYHQGTHQTDVCLRDTSSHQERPRNSFYWCYDTALGRRKSHRMAIPPAI